MAKKPAGKADKAESVLIEGEAVDVTPEPRKDPPSRSKPDPQAGPKTNSKTSPKPDSKPAPAPEDKATPEPAPTADEPPAGARRGMGGALLLLSGGVLAAAIGFAMARYVVPEGWPFPGVPPEPDPLALRLDAQSGELETLKAGLSAAQDDNAATQARLDQIASALPELGQRLDALEATAKALDTRVLALEKMPLGESAAAAERASQAYQRELAAMREMFAAELKRIEDEQKQAVAKGETAEAAAGRAALAKVLAALDEGEPFAAPLTDLQVASNQPVPEALTAVAATGVPTLSALQASFPDAARAAIEAETRAAVAAGEMSKVAAFLKLQVGARSLTPRDGADADAVLSRAEAALRQGELAAALAELSGLPDSARPAMQGWMDQARARAAAIEAVKTLAQAVNGG